MSDAILQFLGVGRVFSETAEPVELFRDLNWSVSHGECVSVTGESGTGKSTLLHLAAALDRPTEGQIFVAGRDVSRLKEQELSELRTTTIGMVFQFHFLLKEFSVLENVLLPAWLAGTPRRIAQDRARHLLDRVGLEGRSDHFPSQLSGGERQRAALARALINDPALILADEPTGNLDERHARIVQELLFRLVEDSGKTLVLVTHDAVFASGAKTHVRLVEGRLVSE